MIDTIQFLICLALGAGFLWLEHKERLHYREIMNALDASPTFVMPRTKSKAWTKGPKKMAPKVNDDASAWRKEHDA